MSDSFQTPWVIPDEKLSEEYDRYTTQSLGVPGWRGRNELETFAKVSRGLPVDAVIVEIGVFFGSGTISVAGARQIIGSGSVFCVDPFDGSGDDFSSPYYADIIHKRSELTPRGHFENNLKNAGLSDRVQIYEGLAQSAAVDWSTPIDMLFLDGDQSPVGARAAYESWVPWLKKGGIIALGNSNERVYDPTHMGNRLLVLNEIAPPNYDSVQCVDGATFARKCV